MHAPLVEVSMTHAAYKITLVDGQQYLVPFDAWFQMIGHSTKL